MGFSKIDHLLGRYRQSQQPESGTQKVQAAFADLLQNPAVRTVGQTSADSLRNRLPNQTALL